VKLGVEMDQSSLHDKRHGIQTTALPVTVQDLMGTEHDKVEIVGSGSATSIQGELVQIRNCSSTLSNGRRDHHFSPTELKREVIT